MSNVYVIADLHFGHAKVAAARGFATVQEHDAQLVELWNATVSKRDVVYVLGDVFNEEPVAQLNGTKKLAMGNHDHGPVERYRVPVGAAPMFSQVRGCFEFDGALLTHIPVHPCQLWKRWQINVHGHMHDGDVLASPDTLDPRYVCVSAERTGLRPKLLRNVLAAVRHRIATGELL